MNRFFACVFAVALIVPLVSTPVVAQGTPSRRGEVRVAVVDVRKVFDGYETWARYQTSLRTMATSHKNRMEQAQKDLEDLQKQIQAMQGKEDAEKILSLEKKMVELEIDAKVENQMFEMTFKQTRARYLDEVAADIRKACDKVATRFNFDLVLSTGSAEEDGGAGRLLMGQSVLFAGPKIDITAQVLQVLNKK